MKRFAPYLAGGAIALLLWLAFRPVPKLPPEVALGTIVIPAELWQRQLEDLSNRKGAEKITRKEVKPTSHAAAAGASASLVDQFVAAAVGAGSMLPESGVHPPLQSTGDRDSTAANARLPPADTVCLGAGGQLRGKSLTLLSACAPDGAGLIDRFHGRNFDWSYKSGQLSVSVSRGPDVRLLAQLALFFAAGYASAKVF